MISDSLLTAMLPIIITRLSEKNLQKKADIENSNSLFTFPCPFLEVSDHFSILLHVSSLLIKLSFKSKID